MSLGALSPDAGGKVSQRQRIGCDRAVFPSAGGDGYGGLGRGLGLRGAAHQQPQEPPQCHRGLPLAAGQNLIDIIIIRHSLNQVHNHPVYTGMATPVVKIL